MLAPSPPRRAAPRLPALPPAGGVATAMRVEQPDWWNAPVPALGDPDAWLVIVGLAPGKHGANRTGRAFTGDASGDLLFATLAKFGLAEGWRAKGVMILNAVKCLPPGNKPVPAEIHNCRPFLAAQIAALARAHLRRARPDRAPVGGQGAGRTAAQMPLRPSRRASNALGRGADR